MRILVINWRDSLSPQAGGAEYHLLKVLQWLIAWGHEVVLICSQFAGAPGPSEAVVGGIRIIRVGSWWNAHWAVPLKARELLTKERFDVLLDDVNKIPFFAPTWSPIPVVALFHHLLAGTVFLETNLIAASALWLYERRVGRVYRDTPSIAVSRSTKEELVERGLPAHRITVIEPGLDGALYRPGVAPKSPTPLLLVVSRLKRYKRVDVAIRALAEVRKRLPEARLIVIGSGERREALEGLARRLDQAVTFLGQVSDEEKVRWMNRAHLVLNPSEKEGWGLVGLEAMACGTPVIASDVPGHRDSVAEGAGILVPAGDARSMGAAALRVLLDPTLAAGLSARGVAWAKRFDWGRVAHSIERELQNAAPRQGSPLTTSTAEDARDFVNASGRRGGRS
jgi:glycosyltransferase involved in cell wall biosynthesis